MATNRNRTTRTSSGTAATSYTLDKNTSRKAALGSDSTVVGQINMATSAAAIAAAADGHKTT